MISQSHGIRTQLERQATDAGFDVVRVTAADAIPMAGERLRHFLGEGWHGDMHWLETTAERRASPHALWPDARSIIMLGMSYAPDRDPLAILQQRQRGAISVYAQGKDYHGIVKTRLKRVAGWFVHATGQQVKVFVDTAPVMEKPLAQAAGIGWQGKHTNLVSRAHGSWLFLGSIFTDMALDADPPETDHCGSCQRCLDICPTAAFPAPYQLDARRCISYLTIEHQGVIEAELRPLMGNHIFGCDDCLAVCPWNKFAQAGREARFKTRALLDSPPLAELLTIDETEFAQRFAGTPVKRAGHARFLRNVLIAAGNSGDASLAGMVEARLADASPLVRGMAVWAATQLLTRERFDTLKMKHAPAEQDANVLAEWFRESPS